MKTNFEPFPILETSRLVLRKFTEKDALDLFEIRSNPEMLDFTDGKVDEFIDDTIRFIKIINNGIDKEKWINFAIVYKPNKKLIGSINLWNFDYKLKKAEVGYALNPLYQKRGLMTEALEAVVKYGFEEMGLDLIEIWTDHRNTSSIKLAERVGFKYIKTELEQGYYKKQTFKMLVYQLRRTEV